MLKPSLAVTPNIFYKPRPNKGLVPLVPSRSAQGFPPSRSVLSMTALLPLKLSPSSSPKSASSRSDLEDQRMVDVDEFDVNFNLAELLAQDLEDSKAAFTSKSMTSGSPIQGLGTAHEDTDDQSSFHGPTIPRYSSPRYQRPVTRYRRNSLKAPDELDELAGDGAGAGAGAGDQDIRMKYDGAGGADSASESSMVMEPLSIRTRQQSVTTAATSISGRCSSFTSPKFLSPASTSSSASFSHKHQQQHHRQVSWFDAEDDPSPTPEEERTDGSNRPSFYFHHRPTVNPKGFDFGDLASVDPNAALRPSVSTSFHFPLRGPSETERPQTSLGFPLTERPRIVNIQPSVTVAVPKRKSSLKRTHGRNPSVGSVHSTHTCSSRERMEQEIAEQYDGEEMDMVENGHFLNSATSMTMLTTSCGRTVIDASRTSSLELAGEPPQRRMQPPAHSSLLNVSETVDFDDGDPSGEYIYPERPTRSRPGDVSRGNIHSWLDSGIERYSPTANISPSTSTPGIPLPPEVLDTLRISLSCFPETMLLSSSLSIETIRAYSTKLKHQVTGASPGHNILLHQNHPDDSRSIFSLSSRGAKRPKRWHLPKLISSHKRDKRHHHSPQNDGNLNLRRGSSISSEHSSPMTTTHDLRPMVPNWASIKTIFPAGSDYLCDALYAHLVVYNYLSTLCPVPIVNPTAASTKPDSHHRRTGSYPESTTTSDRKVPKKAASVLGMLNLLPAQGSGSGYTQFRQFSDGHGQTGNSLRQSASRRLSGHYIDAVPPMSSHGTGSGSGGIETAVIRDLQAGLNRCIGLLVSTLRRAMGSTGGGTNEVLLLGEQSEMLSGRDGRGGEKQNGVDGVLMRALCEVVRVSEAADEGGR